MVNPEITNNDSTRLEVFNPIYKNATLKFTGAGTYAEGLIMGLAEIEAGSVTPDLTTGDGTCTSFALAAPGGAKAGNYNLECITAVTNGGVFKLEDPDGVLLDTLTMTAGAGAATTFQTSGLTFILTDGATDFAQGDKFELAVDAVNQYVPYDSENLDGSQNPSAVMPASKTVTGASTPLFRLLVGGELAESQLSINDASSITETIRKQMQDYGFTLRTATVNDEEDNQ